jgi:hypothetical protein
LELLDLAFNDIGEKGAEALGKCFERNQTLKKLNISWNYIGHRGASCLLNSLKNVKKTGTPEEDSRKGLQLLVLHANEDTQNSCKCNDCVKI